MSQYNNPYGPYQTGYPQTGAPYGQPVQNVPYGQPAQNVPYGQPVYGAPAGPAAQPGVYGQPVQNAPCGQPAAPAPKKPESEEDAKKRKKRNRLLVLIAAVCLLLAVALVVGAVIKDRIDAKKRQELASQSPSFSISELPENLDDGLSTAEIAKKVNPSVVCINVYEDQSLTLAGSGSGIIMNKDGYIITNAHVVENATGVMVQLYDGREFSAQIIGSDKRTDLAVVYIEASDLTPAEFGDSTQLVVGERVVAIGNAAGEFAGSVTQGIISGLNRDLSAYSDGADASNLIQTDAAINPGNSGGALVNPYGQVVGINSSKIADVDYEGIGFAIPISDAKPVLENLIAYGYVKDRAVLGVSVIALTPVTGPANNLPSQGLYISSIEDYSDLPNHDITKGDIILKADGTTLKEVSDLSAILKQHKPGDTLTLEIQKGGSGNVVTVDVKLVQAPTE